MESLDSSSATDGAGRFMAPLIGMFAGGIGRAAFEIARELAPPDWPDRMRNLFSPVRTRCRNTVLVVGLGRSGKTQLIQSLLGRENTSPQRTLHFTVTPASMVIEDTSYRFKFVDYRGQDFGQLVSRLLQEQTQSRPKVRYGEITTLVMVVDLFPYVEGEDPDQKFDDVSRARIDEHLDQWNTTALDAVMALLTKGALRYVCLFINKADKWKEGGRDGGSATVIHAYEPLIRDLKERTSNIAEFDVVVGSARAGHKIAGIDGIKEKLFKHSAPLGQRR